MDYLITGYPHGNGRIIEFAKIRAKSKQEALRSIHQSVWCNYFADEFNQDEYNYLKNLHNSREIGGITEWELE